VIEVHLLAEGVEDERERMSSRSVAFGAEAISDRSSEGKGDSERKKGEGAVGWVA
jgi:hypothetical protein